MDSGPLSNVHFTTEVNPYLKSLFLSEHYDKIAILVDENTERLCLPVIESSLPDQIFKIKISAGENFKTLDTCQHIWSKLTEHGFSRRSLLINLGGGVIGDMGGFCAATFKRGISFINIPTTLLAQVDASVGGKLGVDFNGLKNHIGVFQQPTSVIIDPIFLQSLDHRLILSGKAEMIKHGLISDAQHAIDVYSIPKENIPTLDLIKHSVLIKGKIVLSDEKEQGLRKILNFGHTLGHAIESWHIDNGYDILHGEAVILGIISELILSVRLSHMPEDEAIRWMNALYQWNIRCHPKMPVDMGNYLIQDKKNSNGQVLGALLNTEGNAVYDIPISLHQAKEAIILMKQKSSIV
ncbi:MAG: 3-dehydroquinate synthase [Cyclobacteriaceae bacterium]|nr:3-dehydroquinate synthase [Cyclobacteriaceae bacterium]